MKVYTLTIMYDDKTDEIEFIEEEVTEDTPTVVYKVQIDPEYYDYETLKELINQGLIAES